MDYLHLDHHHVLLQEAIPLSVQVCQTKRAFALWENMFTHVDMKLSIVGVESHQLLISQASLTSMMTIARASLILLVPSNMTDNGWPLISFVFSCSSMQYERNKITDITFWLPNWYAFSSKSSQRKYQSVQWHTSFQESMYTLHTMDTLFHRQISTLGWTSQS